MWTSLHVFWEFFYSILFLLLVAGYLVRIHLILVLRAFSELQTEFEKVKSLVIPLYTIEFKNLRMGKKCTEIRNLVVESAWTRIRVRVWPKSPPVFLDKSGTQILGQSEAADRAQARKLDLALPREPMEFPGQGQGLISCDFVSLVLPTVFYTKKFRSTF
ncbi:hypothetical protein Cgig2_002040 [Carnegiea gigantea]|uniref:Protein Ycf2 n=1 Tax=Carnegiea gigantea TaxID=171969 RepID=A0A9Q1K630_9CARY|nr:hypothetical protein Cgig2_002040 [Carnegiea gigantea]